MRERHDQVGWDEDCADGDAGDAFSPERDPVTGLPSRFLFRRALPRIVAEAQANGDRVGLILIDPDWFADARSRLGHDRSNSLLRAFAHRLRATEGAVLVVRRAGDEFALVLRGDLDAASLATTGAAMLAAVRKPFRRGEAEVKLTASLGAAIFPVDALSVTGLLRRAEAALFYARSAGRDRLTLYDRAMRTDLARTVETGVGQGEFLLQMQPIVAPGDAAALVGVEALMRWQHPTRGLLQPGAFAALFDNPEVAILLGENGFDGAMARFGTMVDRAVPLGRLFLNVSVAQLRWHDFADQVLRLLQRNAMPPERLVLELPHDIAIDETPTDVVSRIATLRATGVGLAFDRALVEGGLMSDALRAGDWVKIALDGSPGVASDVVASAARARQAGAQVIIERIERPDQLRRAAMIGVHGAQGFAVARPMATDQLPAFVRMVAEPPLGPA